MLRRVAFGLALAVAFGANAIAQDTTQPPANAATQSASPGDTSSQTPSSDAASQAPDSHLVAAKDLLVATNAKANIETMIGTLLPIELQQVKKDYPNASQASLDAFQAAFIEEIDNSLDDILTLEAHAYAEHFSEDELRQLAQFYRSDLGRKYLSEVPALVKETAPLAAAWGQTAATNAMRKALEKLRKNGVPL
jgi:uncharacterized protein